MINIEIENAEQVNTQLLRLLERSGNLSSLMADMGEHMVNSTHDNFENSTSPDGARWQANSATTFARLLGQSDTNASGRLNRRGVGRVMNKRPLIANHTLMQSIHYEATSTGVTIGTNLVYGAMMHFGGSRSEFPNLWGDIPARNYLGASEADGAILLDMVKSYMVDG